MASSSCRMRSLSLIVSRWPPHSIHQKPYSHEFTDRNFSMSAVIFRAHFGGVNGIGLP